MHLEITPQELTETLTEEEKGKPARYKYFGFIWYPLERPKLFEDSRIFELGFWQQSPMHERNNKEFFQDKIIRKIGTAPLKPHIHCVNKSTNKKTVNAWIKDFMQVIDNDLTGIALVKKECGIGDIESMLRYELHLNNPMKEHFDIYDFLRECPPYFWNEYAKAYQTEIQYLVTSYIETGEIINTSDVLKVLGTNTMIIQEWLNNRKHLNLVHNMIDENRKNIRERNYKK